MTQSDDDLSILGVFELQCDFGVFHSDGVLHVAGWAYAAAGITSVKVMSGDRLLGVAEIGLDRPDVTKVYPDYLGADRSGFNLVTTSELGPSQACVVTVHAESSTGLSRTVAFELTRLDCPFAPTLPVAEPERLRLFVDEPRVEEGRAIEAVGSQLMIVGWALAQNGVDGIEVFCDGVSMGHAYYGVRREDIDAAFPGTPGALLSGFALSVPRRVLGTGLHDIRVALRDRAGGSVETAFTAEVEAREDDAADHLRRRVPQAEVSTKNRILTAQGFEPHFIVVIRAESIDETLLDLGKTVFSLSRQTWPHWSSFLLTRDSQAETLQPWRRALDLLPFGRTPVLVSEQLLTSDLVPSDVNGRPLMVTVVSAGDELGVDALQEIALSAAINRDVDFFYGDEQRNSPEGGRPEPFLKPAWSPHLLQSTNYIGRLWATTLEVLKRGQVGLPALRRGSDYDLVLRCTEKCSGVAQVPKVLCARGPARDTPDQERAALTESLIRRGGQGKIVDGLVPGTYRLQKPTDPTAFVSIIVPTIAARGHVKALFGSLRRFTRRGLYEVICIDNIKDPADPWKEWIRDNADKVVETTEAFNWSKFNNMGAKKARGGYLLFLNDDIEACDKGWLDRLVAIADDSTVGVVGPQLLYSDGKVQHAGLFLTTEGAARHAFRFAPRDEPGPWGLALTERDVIGVTGACMLMRRAVFDAVGGFNEAHSVVNNDVDFCLESWKRGFYNVYTPHVSLLHHELASRASMKDVYDTSAFVAQWITLFASGDPFYHPQLTVEADDYSPEREPATAVFAGHPVYDKANIQRILIIKLDHIGDFITAMPAIGKVRGMFPSAHITTLVGRATASLARSIRGIDQVEVFDFFHVRSGDGTREIAEAEWEELRSRLAGRLFDLAIDLRKYPDTREILRLSGARVTAGFDQENKFPWLDVALEWEGDNRFMPKRYHAADDLLHLVGVVETGGMDRAAILRVPAARRDDLVGWGIVPRDAAEEALRRPLVCLHPAAGTEMRQWPPIHFARLIDLLVTYDDVTVVIIGAPDDIGFAERIIGQVNGQRSVFSAIGKTTLEQLPRLLAACDLFVGNNSGPHHMAAALGIPTVGIHSGVVDAREWGPVGPTAVAVQRSMTCSPCYLSKLEDCHRGMACLTGLRPVDVYEQAKHMLNYTPRR